MFFVIGRDRSEIVQSECLAGRLFCHPFAQVRFARVYDNRFCRFCFCFRSACEMFLLGKNRNSCLLVVSCFSQVFMFCLLSVWMLCFCGSLSGSVVAVFLWFGPFSGGLLNIMHMLYFFKVERCVSFQVVVGNYCSVPEQLHCFSHPIHSRTPAPFCPMSMWLQGFCVKGYFCSWVALGRCN